MPPYLLLLVLTALAAPAAPAAAYAPSLPCPFSGDAISKTNRAVAELLPEGRLDEGLACFLSALKSKRAPALPADAREAIRGNIAVLRGALEPWTPGARRLLHGLGEAAAPFPAPEAPLPPPPARDPAIFFADGLLTRAECAEGIALFEQSELFEGNVISAGRVLVDYGSKARWEYDVSGSPDSPAPPEWLAVDRRLVGAVVRALALYERANPILRTLRTPLGDEGFRMVRYLAANHSSGHVEQHTFHVDGGQEGAGQRPRVMAAIVYFNEVDEGGETVFLNQGVAVEPRCGRILLFPSAYPYVHAGKRVLRGKKYAATLMITL